VRFSILLPTRNRLELLRYAVQSVLDQDFQDWEVVVSDNASEDDIPGFLAEVADSRIRYVRSEILIPVTDNWNLALENSSGDYIIMLGDDDCLMQRCLSTANQMLLDHDEPELIYTQAVQYYYKDVTPQADEAFLLLVYCEFFRHEKDAFWLPREDALRVVQDSMGFKVPLMYNMQHSVVSRRVVERLRNKGPFFQSPYPDYYATNVLFLTVERILVSPLPLVAIGISPRSFGFFYFNEREDEGVEFLQNVPDERLAARVEPTVLPGTNMNTSWLLAMEAVEMNYGSEHPMRVVKWKYRFMQFRVMFNRIRPVGRFVGVVWKRGTWGERLFWYGLLGFAVAARLFGRRIGRRLVDGALDAIHVSHPLPEMRRRDVPYRDILEMARAENPWSVLDSVACSTDAASR
jgi:glycosyltransferase involved in cell wall biosynthesis